MRSHENNYKQKDKIVKSILFTHATIATLKVLLSKLRWFKTKQKTKIKEI